MVPAALANSRMNLLTHEMPAGLTPMAQCRAESIHA
jgi:hypothetical protein